MLFVLKQVFQVHFTYSICFTSIKRITGVALVDDYKIPSEFYRDNFRFFNTSESRP